MSLVELWKFGSVGRLLVRCSHDLLGRVLLVVIVV